MRVDPRWRIELLQQGGTRSPCVRTVRTCFGRVPREQTRAMTIGRRRHDAASVRKPDNDTGRYCHCDRVSTGMKKRAKRLCHLGNSLALIIDKPLLRSLGLGTRTELIVYSDGRRIIAERLPRPAHDPAEAARIAFDLRKTAFLETAELLEHAIGPQHMEQLGAGHTQFRSFRSRIAYATNGTPSELLLMDRLEHVRAAWDTRPSTEEAIRLAVVAVPEPLPLPRPRRRRRRPAETPNAAPR